MDRIAQLIGELRGCAGWEDLDGATAAAKQLAALGAVTALVTELEALDLVDLSDDAGDVADEVWRARTAISHGLVACGPPAIAPLRPLIAGPPTPAGKTALEVLALLGDPDAAPVAIEWVRNGVRAALVPLGRLAPPGAVEVLAAAIARADDSWTKRLGAHALGEIASDAALDILEQQLADPDWFARLGAVEALREVAGDRARRLVERARDDADPRVSAAART